MEDAETRAARNMTVEFNVPARMRDGVTLRACPAGQQRQRAKTCRFLDAGQRVHVTSSSFPRWDRNLNTGNQREPHFKTARQRIHHNTDRPSWIELPIID
jgi:predicted acyl esterase